MDDAALYVQVMDKFIRKLQRRFATRDANVFRSDAVDAAQNVGNGHFLEWLMDGVAERAFEIATREPNEQHRRPGPSALPLYGVENLVNLHLFHSWRRFHPIPRLLPSNIAEFARRPNAQYFQRSD